MTEAGRLVHWRRRAGLLVLLVLVVGAVIWAALAPMGDDDSDTVEVFDQALRIQRLVSHAPGPRQGGLEPRVPPPGFDELGWESVALPTQVPAPGVSLPLVDAQPVRHRGAQPFQLTWYRVSYRVPDGEDGALALFVPRVTGASIQVLRYEGGRWLVRWDGTEQGRDQWNRPVLVQLGDAGPPGSQVILAVRLTHPDVGGHAMTRIRVGPLLDLQSNAHWREMLQQVAPQVSSLTFASLGLVALLYWLGQRQDHAYLLFALTAVAWTLCNLHYHLSTPVDDLGRRWFSWMSHVALAWVVVLICLFAMRFDPRPFKQLERVLLVGVWVGSVLTMPWSERWVGANLTVWHLFSGLAVLATLFSLSAIAWRSNWELRLIAVALWFTALAGVHDLFLENGWVSLESVHLLPMATMVIFMSFLQAAQSRYAQAIWRVEHANAELEHRLAERESELRLKHERLRDVEREQALLLERQRLMRDMHDGLGSTLMSSLVMVEQGSLAREAVVDLLRECVDDLRLVIDSLEPIDHDLLTLLAALRHRLGRRLEGAGLTLHWEVEDLPPLAWLQPPDALQILRLVQEALTNVLKHAHARHVHIGVHRAADQVQVLVSDDGVGFELDRVVRGRGLRHLEQRATRLGGSVRVDSHLGQGTRVVLDLPLEREGVN